MEFVSSADIAAVEIYKGWIVLTLEDFQKKFFATGSQFVKANNSTTVAESDETVWTGLSENQGIFFQPLFSSDWTPG